MLEHPFAELREIGDVDRTILPAHQIDEIFIERIAQVMRNAWRWEAHEVACAHLVLDIVDARDASPGHDVDPFFFVPMRMIDKRLLARRHARNADPDPPKTGRLRELMASQLGMRVPWM